MEERNPRKLILFGIVGAIVVALIIGLTFFGAPSGGDKKKAGAQSVTVWEVGLDTQAFDPVIAGFKLSVKKDAAVTVTVKKFADYAQYERLLPMAVADGNSPDIIVVSNDGGWNNLGRYVERLPASVVNPVTFRKDFPSFLVDDLLSEDAQDVAGAVSGSGKTKKPAQTVTQIVASLKGVPVGYETPAIFYNPRKLRAVPDAWFGFADQSVSASEGDSGSGSGFSPLGLGLGTSVPGSADILALLWAQQGIRSLAALTGGGRVWESYQAFANSPENNLNQFAPQLKDGLTVLDLFVRGKVGAVVGFPSITRELDYAAKRAGTGEAKIILRGVRASPVPQQLRSSGIASGSGTSANILAVNLVRYRFWALSKYAPHPEAASDLLAYLTTADGQGKLAQAYPFLIPAHRDVLAAQLRTPIAPDWKITKEPFVQDGVDLVGFDKGDPVAWDARLPVVLDHADGDARNLLNKFTRTMACLADQSAGKGYDVACQ